MAHVLISFMVAATPQTDTFNFGRTFAANESKSYTFTCLTPDKKPFMSTSYTMKVVQTTKEGASVQFKTTALAGPMPKDTAFPTLVSNVGPADMPNAAALHSLQELFILPAICGITPGKTAKLGDDVTVKWTNDPKDVTFAGKGHLAKADKDAKTLTVDWDLTLTSPESPANQFKFQSVYSTVDFSLVKSEGSVITNNGSISMPFKMELSPKA